MLAKIILLAVGIAFGWTISVLIASWRRKQIDLLTRKLFADARQKTEEIQQSTREEFAREKAALEAAIPQILGEIRQNIHDLKENLEHQETDLKHWEEKLQQKEECLEDHRNHTTKLSEHLLTSRTSRSEIQKRIYESLVSLTLANPQEIKQKLLCELNETVKLETEITYNRHLQTISHYSQRLAYRILSAAVQRYSVDYRMENPSSTVFTVSSSLALNFSGELVSLFQRELEVDLLCESSEKENALVSIYSTDGYRREIARRVLETVIEKQCFDIEDVREILLRAQDNLEEELEETGKTAREQLHIPMEGELVKLLGRLKYRTSFGQNVLSHSLEVAYIAKLLAMELGLDSQKACCAGLLHDIGKAVDQEKEGGHAEIGGEILGGFYSDRDILEGVSRHHEDVQQGTPYATLISTADAISASRPGARRETFEIYIKRLENLEAIANKIPGVENAFAISAGRELRVMVNPSKVSDTEAYRVAREIAHSIEEELHYPGKIKITVIREMKTELYAR